MDRQILNITANEQILVCENPIKISTNKVNYIQANFDLGQNWQGYDSIRAIWFNDFQTISTVLDSQGVTSVPFEVMKRKGCVKVNLVGSISEDDVLTDRLTSYPVVAVIVDCTAQITGANTSPITPSEFEQFAAAVHEDAERAEAGATASEQSATESANSASASAESAQEAEAHASSAQIYAGMASNEAEASANSASEAQTYAQNASESATDAEGYAEDAESARDTILGMRATANTLSEGSDATASYSNGLLTLGIPRGNTGATGPTGPQGQTGATPNLSIGTVETLDPDEDATATITGTAENPVLSLGIPKGDTGEVSLNELEDATVVQTLSDNTPYNYRRTNGGNGSGHREYDEIVGASVGWNQLVQNGDFANDLNGWTAGGGIVASASGGVCELTVTGNARQFYRAVTQKTAGHKVLISFDAQANASQNIAVNWGDNLVPSFGITATKTKYSFVASVGGGNTNLVFILNEGTIKLSNIQLTDLTLAFGSAIADYVYTLEQSTAGSGVTWLKTHFPRLFDNGYQPFDSGSIKSVSGLTAHEMVGVNQWDEEWEVGGISTATGQNETANDIIRSKNYISVLPNKEYYFNSNTRIYNIFLYDADKNFISSVTIGRTASTYTMPNSCHYMRFRCYVSYGTTYKNDICINLSDTSINGQYFPYEKHTYPLDSSVTLRGQYKLNNGQLYAVGDVWSSDGTFSRNWNEYVFTGNETVTMSASTPQSGTAFRVRLPSGYRYKKAIGTNDDVNILSSKYVAIQGKYNVSDMSIGTCKQYGDSLYVDFCSSASTVEAFVSELTGTHLAFEVETPTTESATPYTSPQWCDSHGTEEYVGSELPVGHSTDYPMSLVDTMPSANGTYEPRVTVTNGVRTVTWVSV